MHLLLPLWFLHGFWVGNSFSFQDFHFVYSSSDSYFHSFVKMLHIKQLLPAHQILRNIFLAAFLVIIHSLLFAQQKPVKGITGEYSDLFSDKVGVELFGELPRSFKNENFTKAIALNEQRLRAAERTGNLKSIAVLSGNLGFIWLNRGDNRKALDYLLKALNALNETNDKKEIALAAGSVGYVYQKLKEYDKALQYYYNAYEISKEQSLHKTAYSISALMAIVYFQKNDTVHSQHYFDEALTGYSSINDKKAKAALANKIGELYLEKNNYSNSLGYLRQALNLREELKDNNGKSITLRNIGLVYFKKGDFEKALENFNASIKLSDRLIVKKLIKDTYLKLATVYSFRNEFAKADEYHNRYRELKEIIARFEKSNANNPIALEQELLEKEKVIALLSKENEAQVKILNQQDLELSQQLTATELERQSKEKALEELNLAMIEKKEKEKQLLLISKQKAENELQLSKNELELNRKNDFLEILAGASLIILVVSFFIYNRYRYKKKSHEILDKAHAELTQTHEELKSTQAQMIQQEKLASLGQMTAGIAHEIQNPLNFVNNFSEVSNEMIEEIRSAKSEAERNEILSGLKMNLEKINHHGKRADSIVKGMLMHSRTGNAEKQLTDINELCEEAISLSYHSMRAKYLDFNCEIEKSFGKNLYKVKIIPQDISRVILNLLNNAFYAASPPTPLQRRGEFSPKVFISTFQQFNNLTITIRDNGVGISEYIKEKIFEPFFTTKPTGEGTGLGLSISHDIIKAHGGEIKVESKENGFTEFSIILNT